MHFDLLAVGDTVIDNFIRLKDASVHCNINNENCEICMRWGDKIPFEFAVEVPAVGNSANAAVAAARLGLSSALQTCVGDDPHGAVCLEALRHNGVNESLVATQAGKRTNYHYVLWFESERTILIKHEQFNYEVPRVSEPPAWVYLSSLGENSLPYHAALSELFEAWPSTKLAFQPGTFQIKFGAQALKEIYARSDIFFCNKEESQEITGSHSDNPKELLVAMHALGPKIVVITDDRRGAYALDQGGSFWYIPMYPDIRPPYERTGAGDAFSSSVVAGLATGRPLQEALLWGPINAMSVVQKVGAQEGLLTLEELQKYLKEAPASYKVEPLP
ncbi:MAG: carbohydrate kinase family protein [Patescibacteria group bacterium]|nr:carbohydrate kinase family protein [Patescibacteria group bacterium]